MPAGAQFVVVMARLVLPRNPELKSDRGATVRRLRLILEPDGRVFVRENRWDRGLFRLDERYLDGTLLRLVCAAPQCPHCHGAHEVQHLVQLDEVDYQRVLDRGAGHAAAAPRPVAFAWN